MNLLFRFDVRSTTADRHCIGIAWTLHGDSAGSVEYIYVDMCRSSHRQAGMMCGLFMVYVFSEDE